METKDGLLYGWRGPRATTLTMTLIAAAAGLLYGLVVHALTVVVRDHGPEGGALSFRGNGAIVVPMVLGLLGLIAAEWLCARRRAWLGMMVAPMAIILGMVVVAGTF